MALPGGREHAPSDNISSRGSGLCCRGCGLVGLASRPDSEVWAYAQAHAETVITKDKDFADIRAYPFPHAGIVIVVVPDLITVATFIQLVLDGLASLAGQSLADTVVTIAPGRVRVRR